MEGRSKTLYRKKLCFGCLGNISKERNAKINYNRKMCKICSGRQPKVSHDLKIQKQKKGSNEDTDTKENKKQKK